MATKKALFTSHTANFSKFNRPFMRWFKQNGYEVHYASAGEEIVLDCDKHFTVPFKRSPLKVGNIKAYKQLKNIIDSENYDIIHTHTPVGSVITRLAARTARKSGTKVIYTAHGFHFYKGAPLVNWLIFYPIERLASRFTDTLITINNEDYKRAKNKMFAKKTSIINGVGTDLKRFRAVGVNKKNELRKKYGYNQADFILVCVGELNSNKNQLFLINQIPHIKKYIPNIKLQICGSGEYYNKYAKRINNLGLNNTVVLTGYRNDIENLYKISDVCVACSIREGLGLNLLEAMATGLPVIASNNRGHREVVTHGVHGFLYKIGASNELRKFILSLYRHKQLYNSISKNCVLNTTKYSTTNSVKNMSEIYRQDIKAVL